MYKEQKSPLYLHYKFWGGRKSHQQKLQELIVRLLVATLHVGMTGKQDGGYTQLA